MFQMSCFLQKYQISKTPSITKELVKSFGIGCTFLLKYTSEGGEKDLEIKGAKLSMVCMLRYVK